MILPALLAVALAALLGAAAFLVLWLDRYGTEPVVRMLLVAGWGLACPLLFRLADEGLRFAGHPGRPFEPDWVPAGFGLLEGLVLAAALALAATSRFLEGPLDGAVYGTVAGLGLAVSASLLEIGAPPPPGWRGFPIFLTLVRGAMGATIGAGIGFAKLGARAALRVPLALAAVLLAGLLRWSFVLLARSGWRLWGAESLAFNLPALILPASLLGGVFAGAISFEGRVLEEQLGEEVRLGVLPEWVRGVLPRYRQRIRSAWWPVRDERREITRLLTSLAYRKHRLRGLPDESAHLYGLEVGRLRQRARTLMALAPGGGAGAGAGE